MTWEMVCGLEVHVELCTASKMFCSCPTTFGAEENRQICPTCAGLPGALPTLNRRAVEFALRCALALGCSIPERTQFDRKSYFYPDLPKSYQISQLYAPIGQNGGLDISDDGVSKRIRIHEMHMEEDAGKLVHTDTVSRIDLNRAGVPLIEIVSEPDFRTADEVVCYLKALRELLVFLGISDCKMQEGSLRADVNLSLRRPGDTMLGTRTEMKNLSSFQAVRRAVLFEAQRQASVLEQGGSVRQETRRWDDAAGKSVAMRTKESAGDYRYFPEPDLPPVILDKAWVAAVQSTMPELAEQKRVRFCRDFSLSAEDARLLTTSPALAHLFETVATQTGQPKPAAHLICGELLRLLNDTQTAPEQLPFAPEALSSIVRMLCDGSINRTVAKTVLEATFREGAEPEAYVRQHGLTQVNDTEKIEQAVYAAVQEHPQSVADYCGGKERAFGFLVGQAMRRLGGTASPQAVRQALEQALREHVVS